MDLEQKESQECDESGSAVSSRASLNKQKKSGTPKNRGDSKRLIESKKKTESKRTESTRRNAFEESIQPSTSYGTHQSRQTTKSKPSSSSKVYPREKESVTSLKSHSKSAADLINPSSSIYSSNETLSAILSPKSSSFRDFKIPSKNLAEKEKNKETGYTYVPERQVGESGSDTEEEISRPRRSVSKRNYVDSSNSDEDKRSKLVYRATSATRQPVIPDSWDEPVPNIEEDDSDVEEIEDINQNFNWPSDAQPESIISLVKLDDVNYFLVNFSDGKSYYIRPSECNAKCPRLVETYRKQRCIEKGFLENLG